MIELCQRQQTYKQQSELILGGKNAAQVCGELSLAMKPVKTFLNPPLLHSSALRYCVNQELTWTRQSWM